MLHAFYDPLDWDSCLAAWAVRHGLGDAVEFHTSEITPFRDMLILNRAESIAYAGEDPISILDIMNHRKGSGSIPTGRNISFQGISKHQLCCLSAWQNFHISPAPVFIAEIDKSYGKVPDTSPAFNALLGIPWALPELDRFISAYEDPQKRINILADGQAILKYRQLRGDLCPH